jgi:activating signal cointegrator 1
MMTLTVRQPWAALIAAGVKRVENRTWHTSYRGPLAIHAGRYYDVYAPRPLAIRERYPRTEPHTRGAIIAVVELVDILQITDLQTSDQDLTFVRGPWCWILAAARAIAPIPCSGRLGLWDCPDHLIDPRAIIV